VEDVDTVGDLKYVGYGIFGIAEAESLAFLIFLRSFLKIEYATVNEQG
jgi:hypothetical protein